jgi:Tol biopolymer transport system component
VAKLSPDGSRLVYSTYVGGSGIDIYGGNVVIDAAGAVWFAGTTTSPDFPATANAFQKSYAGGTGNTPAQEVFPGVSPDGKCLFFCRDTPDRKNDVYWVDAASIPALRAVIAPQQEVPQ